MLLPACQGSTLPSAVGTHAWLPGQDVVFYSSSWYKSSCHSVLNLANASGSLRGYGLPEPPRVWQGGR